MNEALRDRAHQRTIRRADILKVFRSLLSTAPSFRLAELFLPCTHPGIGLKVNASLSHCLYAWRSGEPPHCAKSGTCIIAVEKGSKALQFKDQLSCPVVSRPAGVPASKGCDSFTERAIWATGKT